ncbi:hypothetical protein GW17_00028556 [Ensete ventricosum]|nr:hypothetical protein GW17_00028556 [Ensete ventricosum]RZR92029.1 hypothetical protein BHM03_00020252 [Ensete ventricosum]
MVRVLLSFRLETNLGVVVASWPLLDRSSGIGLACQGVVASSGQSTHNDIDLFLDRLCWTRLMILVGTPFEVDSLGRVGSAPCVPESRPGLFVIVGASAEGEPPSASSGG